MPDDEKQAPLEAQQTRRDHGTGYSVSLRMRSREHLPVPDTALDAVPVYAKVLKVRPSDQRGQSPARQITRTR